MSEKAHVVILHGSFGAPDENWFPWLATELRSDGHKVDVPRFPTPDGQSLSAWTKIFEDEVGQLSADMVLVGHSLAPGFILKLLQDAKQPVRAVFLVSGFLGSLGLEDFDPINKTFVTGGFNWPKIRENGGSIHVYNSDNDPYVPLEKGEEIASRLNVQLQIIERGGHINTSAGFSEFPRLLADIRKVLQ